MSLEQAHEDVRAALYEMKPNLNPEFEFSLVELTTDDIWERLHLQVFKMTESSIGSETFVLIEGRVEFIGKSFGGAGVTQLFATDLNEDGDYELTYTYAWGSGIHRAHLAIYIPGETPSQHLEAEQIFFHGDYLLEQLDAQTIYVYKLAARDLNSEQGLLGKLGLIEVEGDLQLQLQSIHE